MTTVILFVSGAIVGSFLNVVGLRLNSGLSLGGRSSCATCGKTLRFFELVPILSFLILRARCRHCLSKISWQYPLVELWTGLMFVTIFSFQFSILQNLILLAVFCLWVVIAIYDLRHKIIPDNFVYASILLALAFRLVSGGGFIDWLAGPILFVSFAGIWLLTKGRAMGFGDAKLALAVGLLLGGAQGFSAIVLAFWIGAAFGIISMIFSHKKITMKSEVPFAPFIIAGAWISFVFHLNILHVASF